MQLCVLDIVQNPSSSLSLALLFAFQPITCHNVKDVSDTGAICLRLNESNTCVSSAPCFQGGGEQEETGGKQAPRAGSCNALGLAAMGPLYLGVSLGWSACPIIWAVPS